MGGMEIGMGMWNGDLMEKGEGIRVKIQGKVRGGSSTHKPKKTKTRGLKEAMERMGKGTTNNRSGSGRVMEE